MRVSGLKIILRATLVLGFVIIFSTLPPRGKNDLKNFKRSSSSEIISWLFRDLSSCSPVKNIAYLKVHKTGSSAIQNILLRFGLHHNLNFALPKARHYFGTQRVPFTADLISNETIGNFKINIFNLHTVWNYKEIRSVMPEDTVYIASIREPAAIFESLFVYEGFRKLSGMDIDTYVHQTPNLGKRIHSFLGYNQMSWDFGVPKESLYNETFIENVINEIDEIFGLVLVAEKFEQSLILLRHLLCWSYEDVVVMTANARSDQYKQKLRNETLDLLQYRLSSDIRLYNHFEQKFNKLVHAFGEERMANELAELRRVKEGVESKCMLITTKPDKKQTFWKKRIVFKNMEDPDCKILASNEIPLVNYVRDKQIERVRKQKENQSNDIKLKTPLI